MTARSALPQGFVPPPAVRSGPASRTVSVDAPRLPATPPRRFGGDHTGDRRAEPGEYARGAAAAGIAARRIFGRPGGAKGGRERRIGRRRVC